MLSDYERHMIEDDGDTRTCTLCGEQWPEEWDCCTNPRCSVGEANIADARADAIFEAYRERYYGEG